MRPCGRYLKAKKKKANLVKQKPYWGRALWISPKRDCRERDDAQEEEGHGVITEVVQVDDITSSSESEREEDDELRR